ncbi:MAG: hypothetical protein ACTSVU_09670 [Promethearchaeota archaeon]
MKFVLLDTNIIIQREDPNPITAEIQELFQIMTRMGYKLRIHPKSIEEMERDKDHYRRDTNLTKIKTYEILKSPPDPFKDTEFIKKIGNPSNSHDINDLWFLYCVFKNRVDFLITEDKKLISHATRIDLDEKVFSINEGIQFFKGYLGDSSILLPSSVKPMHVYDLDIKDPFFKSLRKDYNFDTWFKKTEVQNRKCWVHFNSEKHLEALCIYKIENEILPFPDFPKKKRIKLSTFKVSKRGYKIGELFIKASIQYAITNNINEIYLTVFPKHQFLRSLLIKFGFIKIGSTSNTEEFYIKYLYYDEKKMKLEKKEINKSYLCYPCIYIKDQVNKFVIPIQPKFHNKLFSQNPFYTKNLDDFMGKIMLSANTIQKVYLTHSNNRKMKAGDIIIFYRSKDKMRLTNIGIIDSIKYDVVDYTDLLSLAGKRSVYTSKELKKNWKGSTTVILFREHFFIKESTELNYEYLNSNNLIPGPIQTVRQIKDNSNFNKIIKESGIDGRYFIN